MIRRFLIFSLIAILGIGTAHAAASGPAACKDDKGLIEPGCAAEALKTLHEQQLAALRKAGGSLDPARGNAEISGALDVLVDTVASVIRDRPRNGLGGFEFLPETLFTLRQQFHLHGWPEPADVPVGVRFLQTRLRGATGPEREAIVTAAVYAWRVMVFKYEPWIPQMVLWQDQELREDYRKALAAVRETAAKNSSYFERVIARFTGSRRFEGAPGLLHFLTEAIIMAVLLGFILAYGAFKNGGSAVGIIRTLLIAPPAIVVSGILFYVITAFTGDPGNIGFLLWLVGAFLLFVVFARKVNGFWPEADLSLYGSARWANFRDMRAARRVRQKDELPQGFALGRAFDAPGRADPRLFYQGHVLTVAPTGTGKGVGAVIPNLLAYEGSAIVLDIKGENFAVTARTRASMGQEICLIDPFGVTGAKPQGLNWFDVIDISSQDCVSISENLAEMLVIPSEAGGDSIHFEETARELLRGLLLFIATLPPERRNMGELRRLITLPSEEFLEVLTDMAISKLGFEVIARTANNFIAKPEKERGSVLSTAQRHTNFLDDPRIVTALERSDFTMADLKTKAKTIYIVLPPNKLATNSRFLRGFIGLALAAITGSNIRPRLPVVFMLDEFAQLGRMAAVEDAIPLVRGYGAAFWIFVQDLSQIKAVYPKWQTFLANAAQQYFGVADYDTARYVSEMLGQTTVEFQTRSTSNQDFKFGHGSTSTSQQFTGRALLTPDEVMKNRGAMVFIAGERPYGLQPLNYLSDPEYAGLAGLNPYYAAA